jgi:hypothetical protein
LGRGQPKLIAFYDRHGREITDIEPTGVDSEGISSLKSAEDTIEEEENDLDLLNPGQDAILVPNNHHRLMSQS